jgi:DNA polymerase-3 subunit alpha
VQRAKSLGLSALGMTDHGNIFGHIAHWAECKKAKIKPILGSELYITHKPAQIKDKYNRNNSHMVVWAKNKNGWLNLIKLISQTNDPEYFYYKPRIGLYNWTSPETAKAYKGLESFLDGSIMAFSGHQGSHLSDNLFCNLYDEGDQKIVDLKKAYGQYKEKSIEFYRKFLKADWLDSTCKLALELERLFGKGNFFVELQNELNPKDQLALWIHPLIVECLRQVSKETGIPSVASSDPHYPSPDDAQDQRIMVMTNLKETEESVAQKLSATDEMDVMVFFGSDSFYIHSPEEMSKKFTKDELAMSVKIAATVEEYDISHKPYIPNFELPEFNKNLSYLRGLSNDYDKFLMHMCVEGAKVKQPWNDPEWEGAEKKSTRDDYWQRLQDELGVICKANLSNYFLVVWDYCMAADNKPADQSFNWQANLKNNGKIDPIPRADGRGSAAGCLVSYLIGITNIDPLLYGLSFSRFYNEGRNSGDHIELPDIDIDFAVEDREWVIDYIANKYGRENVAQMITFQRMQGRAAIKDVLRVKGIEGGFELANEICKFIPGEAEIADELRDLREIHGDNYGILKWALDNSKEIHEFYNQPHLKPLFDQAVRCEGVKRAQGKHPSGIIVTPEPVQECFPLALDTKSKNKDRIIAVDMNDVVKMGGVKYDILGTAILDKLKMTQDLVNGVVPRRNRLNNYIESED